MTPSWSVFLDWHWSNSTDSECWQCASFDVAHHYQWAWLLYMLNLTSNKRHQN